MSILHNAPPGFGKNRHYSLYFTDNRTWRNKSNGLPKVNWQIRMEVRARCQIFNFLCGSYFHNIVFLLVELWVRSQGHTSLELSEEISGVLWGGPGQAQGGHGCDSELTGAAGAHLCRWCTKLHPSLLMWTFSESFSIPLLINSLA